MAGYQPAWVPAGPAPDAPGRGIPKWRAIAVLAIVLGLLTQLPTERVQADSFGGTDYRECFSTHALVEFNRLGYGAADISFRIDIEDGGTFFGRWETASGYIGGQDFWSAGESGAASFLVFPGQVKAWNGSDWVVTAGGNYTRVQFASVDGNLRYVFGKVSRYGGCANVSNIVGHRYPITSGSPAWGGSGSPDASQSPDASAPGSPPAGMTCESGVIEECVDPEPYDGWCWVDTILGPQIQQCAVQPSPSASAGALAGAPEACQGATQYVRMTGPWNFGSGGGAWYYMYDGGGLYQTNGSFGQVGAMATAKGYVTASAGVTICYYVQYNSGSAYTEIATNDGGVGGAARITGTGWAVRTTTGGSRVYGPLTGTSTATSKQYIDVYTTGGTLNQGGAVPSAAPSGSPPMPSGWPSYPPLPTFGAFPSFAWPSYPPFAWPSLPPFPSGSIGADICAAASPGGPTPPIMACETVTGTSFAPGVPDASGAISGFDALASAMAGKVPFGIVPQVGEALGGFTDSPAGPAVDWCNTVPLPMFGSSSEFCVPDNFFAALADWRWLFAGVIWVLTALALLRIAMRSVGAGSSGGEA